MKSVAELLNYKQKNKDMDEFIKVPMSEKLAYCFGDPALTLMYTMTTTLLIYFYTNVVGISAGSVGMIMLVSRETCTHRKLSCYNSLWSDSSSIPELLPSLRSLRP